MSRPAKFVLNEAHEDLFCFTVMQLMMVWTAYREGHISLKHLRTYFALAELLAQSRAPGEVRSEAAPRFSAQNISALIGGKEGVNSAVKKLLAVGLLRAFSQSTIEFATDPSELRFLPETLDAALTRITNAERLVPVPRKVIRFIAAGARCTQIATILGHLIRCLRRGPSHPQGCVKASWIAEVFGVSRCGVKSQRRRLVELGWLIPQGTGQKTLNLHGLSMVIDLAWGGVGGGSQTFDQPAVS